MRKVLYTIISLLALVVAWGTYRIAMPSSSCVSGMLCNNRGWNGNTTLALLFIIVLIWLAGWLLKKVRNR